MTGLGHEVQRAPVFLPIRPSKTGSKGDLALREASFRYRGPRGPLVLGVGITFLLLLVHLLGLGTSAFDIRHGDLGGRIPNQTLAFDAVQLALCVLVAIQIGKVVPLISCLKVFPGVLKKVTDLELRILVSLVCGFAVPLCGR